MKLTGEHILQVSREAVWQALLDADVLSRCLPGFERLERVSENDFEGALTIRVGPVEGQFQGRLSVSDLNPPSGYGLKIKGQGAPGFINGAGTLQLADRGDSTLLTYEMEVQVGGRIAGVGQRLLESSARALSDQAMAEFSRILQGKTRPSTPEPKSSTLEAPSQAEFAAKVAKGVVANLVPAERRPLMVMGVLTVVVVVIVLLFRFCGS